MYTPAVYVIQSLNFLWFNGLQFNLSCPFYISAAVVSKLRLELNDWHMDYGFESLVLQMEL